MSVGKVTCICSKCGKNFEVTKKFYKSREAQEWEELASENVNLCTQCYKEEHMVHKKAAEKWVGEKYQAAFRLDTTLSLCRG